MSIKNRHEYLHFCELIDTHDTISHPIQYSLPKKKSKKITAIDLHHYYYFSLE